MRYLFVWLGPSFFSVHVRSSIRGHFGLRVRLGYESTSVGLCSSLFPVNLGGFLLDKTYHVAHTLDQTATKSLDEHHLLFPRGLASHMLEGS